MIRQILSRAVLVAATLGGACGGVEESPPMSTAPTVPTLDPGMAMLAGKVITTDGMPIAGATVTMLDRSAVEPAITATTGADGSWQLTVPGTTDVNLRVEAMNFAPTRATTVAVAKQKSSVGMEIMMIPPARLTELSGMMGGAKVDLYGVVAVDVKSVSGACDPAGGKVLLTPSPFGRVVYGKADQTPDMTLTTMQAGARPSAWVLGVLPSGTYYNLKFEKAGCTQVASPVLWSERSYKGHLPVETKALSHAMIFVQ